ncbi:MAG: ABC transporter substrate-binding protein [Anaerolineales bacterium]|nr:ABC transporter substrate-binding protein [Anaerolineales bacterium]
MNEDLIGKTLLGRYRIESFIGRGGMSEVYKVWDSKRSVNLAMKLLREDLAEDRVFMRRFEREARTLADLQHPHIVRFYGLEQDKFLAFMLLDYVEGTTLRREIYRSKGPFKPERVLEILRPVCAALNYAHKQGVVHCDAKPGNIMIDRSGKVLVTDFGIARMTDAATATMVGMGTPAYMAPEQVRGLDPTPQTDIYALGVLMFEMLTGGERPFTGERATVTGSTSEKVRWEQINLEPPSPKKWNPEVSSDVESVVNKCLEKDPGERFTTVHELLLTLESIWEGRRFKEPVEQAAYPPPSLEPLLQHSLVSESEKVRESPIRRGKGEQVRRRISPEKPRRWIMPLGLITGALIFLLIITVVLWGRDKTLVLVPRTDVLQVPTSVPQQQISTPVPKSTEGIIKIGMNNPMGGNIPKVGEGAKFAGEMWLTDINAAGGLDIAGKKYQVELIIEDNESEAELAASANTKLITHDEVLIIIGPHASKQAVPAGEIANNLETPMISPWSTNPRTTLDRPWVFRACFLDPLQGLVVANFATEEFGFTKAAVLFDVASNYSEGLAESFKAAWESLHGQGSVVAFETFKMNDTNFNTQLTTIISSGAEFLFAPQYFNEVPLIVRQAHVLGWDKPIMGSDSWGSEALINLCGGDCSGLYFSTHYTAHGATGATKTFIERYKAAHGYTPNDVAALTWDTMLIAQEAIQACGNITGDLVVDRKCVRDALARITDFNGITGKITLTEDGDPIKCAVIVKISDAGEFTFYKQVCP